MGHWERRGGGPGLAESDAGRVLAIVEQPMILVLSTTLVSTTRHTVEQEIKRGNLTGHAWVIDDAEAECWAAQFRPHEGLWKQGKRVIPDASSPYPVPGS